MQEKSYEELKIELEAAYERIDELQDRERWLEGVAFKDNLTGCYNRAYLGEVAKPLLEKEHCYLAYIDLNDLKLTNDNFGHAAGNKRLIKLVETLESFGHPIRIGGDEFLMVFGQTGCAISLESFASGQKEFSVGIVEKESSESFNSAIKRADEAMYLDKCAKKAEEPDSLFVPIEIQEDVDEMEQ